MLRRGAVPQTSAQTFELKPSDSFLRSNTRDRTVYEEPISSNSNSKVRLLEARIKVQRRKILFLQENLRKVKRILADNRKKHSTCLKKYLTPGQVKAVLSEKTRTRWSVEDIRAAVTLRALSSSCYSYLRNRRSFPLPGLSTLRRWTQSISCKPGLLYDIIELLKQRAVVLDEREKVLVLSVDEMSISKTIEYDKNADILYGPFNNMCIFMIRSLFQSWKQPIYVDFDICITKALLSNIIREVESAGFRVEALVSDMGAQNQKLWRELDLNYENPNVIHPCDESRVLTVFADVPHLIKLLRNHCIQQGLEVADPLSGEAFKVDKQLFYQLIDKDSGELKVCPKITASSLEMKGASLQRVRPAVQLFSAHVANAFEHLNVMNDSVLEGRIKHFISVVDKWFDILNSRVRHDSLKPWKSGYGLVSDQDTVLTHMIEYTKSMRIGKRKMLLPFQKGIIMSTIAVQKLFLRLRSNVGAEYLLTHRLNQDCLENFFSRVRSTGRSNTNPSPIQALNRIRLLIVGYQDSEVVGANSTEISDTDKNEDAVLSAKILKPLTSYASTQMDNITTNNACITELSCTEKDACCYLSGFVAFKFKCKHPQLSAKDYSDASSHDSWINKLSQGFLTRPSQSWFNCCLQLENHFVSVLKDGVVKSPMKSLMGSLDSVILRAHAQEAISLYFRCRIYIRLRSMNKSIVEEAYAKRKKAKMKHVLGKK